MAPIDDAIAAARSQKSPCLAEIARNYGVSRSTLSRRLRGVQSSKAFQYENQRLLTKPQERMLVQHINKLTKHGLLPTLAIVRNFVREIGGKEPSKMWISRFVAR
jgi:IS30 family transposase